MRVALVHDYLNQYGGAESFHPSLSSGLRSLKPLGFSISATGNPRLPKPLVINQYQRQSIV